MDQQLIFTNDTIPAIQKWVATVKPSTLFIVCDENTASRVGESILTALPQAQIITIGAGDKHKDLVSVSQIWEQMSANGGTRRSAVINAGGGMITDIGGFAAATFKRGVRFLNLPTTLLGAVDAAVGGKTGFNFNGLKNEIGDFAPADAVVISTRYFSTLPSEELLSGYAEMIKHGLISSREMFIQLLDFNISHADLDRLLPLLEENVMVKKHVVDVDPKEQGLRKALNLGHTPGHAFEAWALHRERPVPHGYAVAWGLVVDLILSHLRWGFPSEDLHLLASYVKAHYATPCITCDDYPELLEYMRHDKKNARVGEINFTLLAAPGDLRLDSLVPDDDIRAALDIFRDLTE